MGGPPRSRRPGSRGTTAQRREGPALRWHPRYGVLLLAASVVRALSPAYRYGIGLDGRFRARPRTAAHAGALSGLAYLKLYALPFALVMLPTALLLHRFVGPAGNGRLERSASAEGRLGMAAAAAVLFVALLPPALDGLALKWNSRRELAGILATVEDRGLVPAGAAVASEDNWQRSAILCFSLECAYHGHPADAPDAARLAELRASGIDRYLVWSSTADPPGGLPILAGPDELDGLRVYEVPPP